MRLAAAQLKRLEELWWMEELRLHYELELVCRWQKAEVWLEAERRTKSPASARLRAFCLLESLGPRLFGGWMRRRLSWKLVGLAELSQATLQVGLLA